MRKVELNIEQILQSERAWEYILLDIVRTEDLDPWDIDITKLTETYTKKIKKMKELDLRIPARIILAAAILLKMQSDQLIMSDEEEERFEELFSEEEFTEEDTEKGEDEFPILDLRIRRKPARRVTLEDLISNLQKALVKKEKPIKFKPEPFELKLEEEDISEKIDELYAKILKSKLKKIAFSNLLSKKTRSEVIGTLLPLLHLANDGKIDIEQEEFFKEIFILKE